MKRIRRHPRILCALAALPLLYMTLIGASSAVALDLPFQLGFQIGFGIRVLPAANDMSGELGLVVAPDRIRTDRAHFITLTGTISNFSDAAYDGVAMGFAVTSYIGTGVSRGTAVVEPRFIPPGGVAAFTARINLASEKPRFALYAVNAAGAISMGNVSPGSPAGVPAEIPADAPAETEGPPEIPGF